MRSSPPCAPSMLDDKAPSGSRLAIPFVDLAAQYFEERDEILACVDRVFRRGDFVGGADIAALEAELAAFCGVRHVVALNSGTDALILGMAALGIGRGDEVITPANSFVASTAAIVHLGAEPVFADVLPDQTLDPAAVAAAITPRTRAIMPVHLTGRMAAMAPLLEIASAHGLAVVEDAAQSIGSHIGGRRSGSFGTVGCFSTHPLKNLNAAGDGGFITTDDERIATWVRRARNHGLVDRNTVERFGSVSRLDTLQAALLRFRLTRLPSVIERRRRNAALYRSLLDPAVVFFPPEQKDACDSVHLFVIQVDRRDALRTHLAACGIGSGIHYPIPIHLQPAAAALGDRPGGGQPGGGRWQVGALPETERQADRILSLPVHQFLTPAQIETVATTINGFFRGS